jgi:hypothetical protein
MGVINATVEPLLSGIYYTFKKKKINVVLNVRKVLLGRRQMNDGQVRTISFVLLAESLTIIQD